METAPVPSAISILSSVAKPPLATLPFLRPVKWVISLANTEKSLQIPFKLLTSTSFYDGHLSSITRLSKHGLRFWLQSQISSLSNGPFLVICCVRKFNVCLIKHDDPVTLYPISVAWSFRPSLQLAQRHHFTTRVSDGQRY